jgi:hypothetical protein
MATAGYRCSERCKARSRWSVTHFDWSKCICRVPRPAGGVASPIVLTVAPATNTPFGQP